MRAFISGLIFLCLASGITCSSKQSEGEAVINKIEQFRSRENRLPGSLNEIGIREAENGPIYYERITDNRYRLWYGTTLGESVTYDSERKTWE